MDFDGMRMDSIDDLPDDVWDDDYGFIDWD